MATEDLNKTIEESLQLAVSNGKLNDEIAVRHVSERDDPLQGITKILDKRPDPRALDLEERYNKIFDKEKRKGQKGLIDKFFGNDDDDDDDDSLPGSPRVPPAPPSPPTGAYNPFGPPPPLEDDDPLIRPPREYFFPYSARIEARNYDIFDQPTVYDDSPAQINLDGNLREVSPYADKAFETERTLKENNYFKGLSDKLDSGEIPEVLEFFLVGSAMLILCSDELSLITL